MAPYENVREFIRALEQQGELRRIGIEVDRRLEVTEIADRVMKSRDGGPALLFERIRGASMPLLINAFGSRKRMQMICGSDALQDITENFLAMLEPKGPLNLLDKLKLLPKLKRLNDLIPQEVKRAPCMEVTVEDPSFDLLPVCTCWPQDGGPFVTLPMVFTKDPRSGVPNCGMYRMQIYDARTCGMHWHLHKGGAEHLRKMKEKGELLPVSVAIGADPAEVFSATVPLPPDVDEMMFAGLLRGSPVKMVKSRTNDLLVPAESEIVLEGYVDPVELRLEGPFGDHTGYYSLPELYPVFHLTAMSMRRDPIYMHTIVGVPPMEDAYIGEAIEQLLVPVLQRQFPEIADMHMPVWGVFHNLMLISLRKAYPGHARKIMHGIWGLGQAMFTKLIVVVDEDIDLRDYGQVVWRAANCVDYARDVEIVKGPVDDLDHASQLLRFGGKMGIDATTKWPAEGVTRPWPDIIKMDPETTKRVDEIWGQLRLET